MSDPDPRDRVEELRRRHRRDELDPYRSIDPWAPPRRDPDEDDDADDSKPRRVTHLY